MSNTRLGPTDEQERLALAIGDMAQAASGRRLGRWTPFETCPHEAWPPTGLAAVVQS